MTLNFLLLWLMPAVVAGLGLILMTWWSLKHPRSESDKVVKLSELITGILASLCPLINIFVALAMVFYFMSEIAPNIVLVGRRP